MKKKECKCLNCGKVSFVPVFHGKKYKFCSASCSGKHISLIMKNRKNEYIDSLSHEQKMELLRNKIKERVVRKDECMVWTGYTSNGYGEMTFLGKKMSVHRAMYRASRGEIPKGMYVCHTCDNPPCCNPLHLFCASPKDNTKDAVIKGRFNHCVGSKHTSSKLTEDDVREIKRILKRGGSSTHIARNYNVHVTTIERIKYGKGWKHI